MRGGLTEQEIRSAATQNRPEQVREQSHNDQFSYAFESPLISVITVNFNGRHHLKRCLPSLLATTDREFEVIVVDNGSTDGSIEWLNDFYPQVRVLPLGSNRGFGEANRFGVEAARGSYIALVNNDTEVEPDWLTSLLQAL